LLQEVHIAAVNCIMLYLYYCCTLASWKEELQKYISPDNLPEYYGGTRREPDPTCSKYVCTKSVYYMHNGVEMYIFYRHKTVEI